MIKKLLQNKLIKDNITLLIGVMALNILGFFFHFIMGRALGPADYGILGSLLSLIYLMIVPFYTIQTGISKFISKFKVQKQFGKISFLITNSIKKLLITGIIIAAIFTAFSYFIAGFLKIPLSPLLLLGVFFIFALLLPIIRGSLQGLQFFKALGINNSTEGIVKLGLGVLFVYFGFKVNGAVTAIILSYIIAFFLGFLPLRKVLKTKKEKFDTKSVLGYSLPILVMITSLTFFYSIDLILVKHFFPDIQAGYYAALALLGKVVFFGSLSISQVMFPKVTELYETKKPSKHLLNKSLLMVLGFSALVTLVYFLVPNFVVNFLFGSQYLEITKLLGYYALIMSFFSLNYLIAFYNVSIHRNKFIYLLVIFNMVEVFLIWFYHSSLLQVITIFLILMVILFVILFATTQLRKDETIITNNPST